MTRSIITFAALVLVCVPLLVVGFFLIGAGALFVTPACWLGNKLGGFNTEGMLKGAGQ